MREAAGLETTTLVNNTHDIAVMLVGVAPVEIYVRS